MVLGLFEGSMELRLSGNTFASGQKIPGTVSLKLNQPKKARELRLEFYGEIRHHSGKHTRIERVFQVRQQLSGERTYNTSENFSFEIQVPNVATVQAPGILGTLMGMFTPRPTFYVHASLDAPNELDINKRVMVNITSGMVNVQQSAVIANAQPAIDISNSNAQSGQQMRDAPQ
jgi:hypothetical protein